MFSSVLKSLTTIAVSGVACAMLSSCAQTKFGSPSGSSSAPAGGDANGSLNQPAGAGNGASGSLGQPAGPGTPYDGTLAQPPGGNGTPGVITQPPSGPPQTFDVSNCQMNYPVQTSSPRTSSDFNESDVLAAFSPQGSVTAAPDFSLNVWYTDEHAMTLGVRQVRVIDAGGQTTSTNYPVSPLGNIPDAVMNPAVGTIATLGDQAGTDVNDCGGASCGRPLFPAAFVTDITSNPASTAGDWQYGGRPVAPTAVYGTWKSAVRTVDNRTSPATVTIATDGDPQPNNWNLGKGLAAPAGVSSSGYGALVSWNLAGLGLQAHHSYRVQFMIHDGDQYHQGGDAGENCVKVQVP